MMAKPSISVPDELLNKFDDMIWEAKRTGDFDRDVDRSEVLRELIRLWMQSRGADVAPQNPDIVRSIVEDGPPGGFGDDVDGDPWGGDSGGLL